MTRVGGRGVQIEKGMGGVGGGLGRPQMLFFSSGLEDSTLKQGIIKTSKVLSEGFITISCILYKSPRMI